MSDYAVPDGFGAISTGIVMTDPATGTTWQLGFGPDGGDGVPAVIWVIVSTWARAKTLLGPTWATGKAAHLTWGQAKAIVAS